VNQARRRAASPSATARPATNPSRLTICRRPRRDGLVGGHDHDREVLVAVLGHVPDRRRGDVDAVLAEARPHAPDHAGDVAVAEERDVVLELQVEAVPPGLEQVRAVAAPSVVPTTRTRCSPLTRLTRTRSAKSRAWVPRVSVSTIPRSSASAGALTGVDVLLGVAREDAEQDLDRQRAGVALGDAPEQLDVDAVDARALAEAMASRPSWRESGRKGPEHLHVLGGHGGDVDRARHHAAGERRDDLLGGLEARADRWPRRSRRPGAASQ
jgi:hypothetical protein